MHCVRLTLESVSSLNPRILPVAVRNDRGVRGWAARPALDHCGGVAYHLKGLMGIWCRNLNAYHSTGSGTWIGTLSPDHEFSETPKIGVPIASMVVQHLACNEEPFCLPDKVFHQCPPRSHPPLQRILTLISWAGNPLTDYPSEGIHCGCLHEREDGDSMRV